MKRIIAFFPTLIFSYITAAQPVPGERIPLPGEEKRLQAGLKTATGGIPRAEALLQLASYFIYFPGEDSTDLAKGEQYRQVAAKLCDSIHYRQGINQCMLLKGTVYHEKGKRDSVTQVFSQLKPLLEKDRKGYHASRDFAREAQTINQLAHLYDASKDYTQAIATYNELVGFYAQHRLPGKHYPLYSLSAYYSGSDKSRWLYYLHEAETSMDSTGDYTYAAMIYNDLGNAYRNIGQLEKGLNYFLRSYEYFRKLPSFHMYVCLYGISEAYTKLGKPQLGISVLRKSAAEIPPDTDFNRGMISFSLYSCLMAAKDYGEAEKELKLKAWHWRNLPGIELNVAKDLAELYVESGQSAKARPLIDQCVSSGEYDGRVLSHLHFLGFKADSAAGDHLSALRHLLANKELDNTENEKQQMEQSQELQVKYETEKKDRELLLNQQNIRSLQEKDRLRQTSFRQATLIKNMTIIGIVLLLVILVLLLNQFRLKINNSRELARKNITLEQLVDEKEWLLKEVHHRVKNNLHTIISLLETQSVYLRDDALAAIQNSQHRVYAMSLIHQRLYQKENSTIVEMAVYLPELASYLEDSYDTRGRISFLLDIEKISLDISQAIPLGLILNEAVTNSIKYAFPENAAGEIRISLTCRPDDDVELSISDNGTGLPEDIEERQQHSIGLRLMKGLSDDLKATYLIRSSGGTIVTIRFQREIFETGFSKSNSVSAL
ncbi:MAG: sensor histidine kinase [Chitinophagaceae bacterium]|nr:MAG: sensor histidine kinase [Chitinophagaceae bacterium]